MGRITRIIMFEGDIETTAYFSRQMEKTFQKEGYETFFYDYKREKECAKELLLFLKKDETALVTFNFHGLCGNREIFYDEVQGGYIWDDFRVPCINIVVDHPLYYHRLLQCVPKGYVHISIDKNHERYMEEYFPEITRGPFLPLAGTGLLPKGAYKPIKNRSMDIVFTGNYVRPENFDVYIERAGEEYAAFYRGILQELKEQPALILEDVAKRHIYREIPEATHDEVKETLSNMTFLDMYIRFYFRQEAVRILADAGFPVHVFGIGWDEAPVEKKENVIIGGSLDSLECLEKIADSKISLNVMPWFKEGAHDRIFNSMLNGAVCLTDSSLYLDRYLRDGENAALFTLEGLSELPQITEKLLKDENKMQSIADRGYDMAKKDHTWEQRALKLIELLHAYD
ncbi:MAG: glycosyltransferase [Lachnospiraceae bacterium]|nr:glycosyltransferase [Lachnospiraceae bacterium]